MTPRNIAQQNAERRLRHSTWQREPAFPAWALWLALALASPFLAAGISWSAQ